MRIKDLTARESAAVGDLLSEGSPINRRHLLISAAAFGAAQTLPDAAQAQIYKTTRCSLTAAHTMPSPRNRPYFHKDIGNLVDLNASNQGGAYWNYSTYITPVDEFFIRNEHPTPRPETEQRVTLDGWRLKIHGNGVERPITLTYNDLMKMPSRTITSVMECAGNGRTLFWEQLGMTEKPQLVGGTGWGFGGIGQAEWEYVPIGHILDLVGVKDEARWALFWSGIDTAAPGAPGDTGRPVPVDLLETMPDTIGLAFKMNGKPLTPDHGAPVRALVPGWCGAASTKWLSEIKIATHNFWVPLNSFRHVMIGPEYEAPKPQPGDEFRFVTPEKVRGPMVTWLPAKSMITVPLVLEKQPKYPHNYPLKIGQRPRLETGAQMVKGYAWAPQAGVGRVEYRVNGSIWQRARLLDKGGSQFNWVRFGFDWDPGEGNYTIETRVTDRKGRTQPAKVPYNEGGFDFAAIPKFHVEVA